MFPPSDPEVFRNLLVRKLIPGPNPHRERGTAASDLDHAPGRTGAEG